MVAAVAPSSSPTPAGNVQETQTEKKKEVGNVQNYGGLPPAEKVKVVRKTRTMEITSRYKSAITAPSPPVAPAGSRRNPSPLSRNPSPLSRNPSPARQPSPASSSRQPSPVRNRSTSSSSSIKGASESLVRHPSPTLGRSINAPEVLKRSYSTERRRPWPAVTPSSESKSTPTSSTTDGLASSTKVRPQTRGPELWPSMSAAKQSADSNDDNVSDCLSEGGTEKEAPSKIPKPALNSAGNGNGNGHVLGSPSRKGSPMRRQSIDQAETTRPTENSHSKPDQQRWPGMSTGKVSGGTMTRSMDLNVDRERPLARSSTMTAQSRPGTPSSRIKATPSRSFNRSVNEAPVATPGQTLSRRNPTPTRGRTGTTENAAREPGPSTNGNGAHPSSNATGPGEHATHARRLSQESVATVDSLSTPQENMSDTESVSSGGSIPGSRAGRGTTVPARVWQDMNGRIRRFSEGDRSRSSDVDLPAVAIAPVKTVRRTKVLPYQPAASMLMNQSMNGSTTSAWALSPGRASGNSAPSTPHPPSSPSHSKGTSPLRGLPSPQRSRPVHGSAAALAGTARNFAGTTLSFGIDGRSRGKKTLTQQEEAQLLRILHNRWLQWRFVNARAEAVMSAQKAAAERQLYNVWLKTSELRTSVAMQRIKLQQARQAHKLRSILSTHATHLEDWETLEEEHSNALTGCMEALESAILRVPVTGGARADVQAVKEALNSAVDVLNAVEASVHFLLPKTDSMEALLSQLAETAAQERALLEECGDLLSVAAALEVEERSLRTHLIQLENERQRLFKAESLNGTLNASSSYLSTP
ncbi:uncharacterized protein [Physcomitrium patens]|uniref:Uncharacterized protein n=1 Tax=Physcomitrium patens TaxID=3218 RepID=A0A7I4CLH6_PHYPA|nr:QWRF motif-containing protein 9-like [Physcomitrium patens]|eukprot:XP_024364156.1 QWRF motif-containing protein 9-like [Physcomitrella patens]